MDDVNQQPCGFVDCPYVGTIPTTIQWDRDDWRLDYTALMGLVCGEHYEALVSGRIFRFQDFEK